MNQKNGIMRVLHIGKYFPPYPGGIENFLKDLLRGLEQEGVETAALVHQGRRGKPIAAERLGKTAIHRVPIVGQVLYVPVSPAFPRQLGRVLGSFRPHILHFHLPNVSAFWALFNRAAREVPWVVQWQSDVVPSFIDRRLQLAYQFYRPFEQALLARSRKVIVASPPYLDSSGPLAAWRSKSEVIPLGVDPGRLPKPAPAELAKAEASWPPGALKVLAVGRLTYYKGFEKLIRAAKEARGISVQLVGEGALRERLLHEIQRHGLQDRVVLRGGLGDPELQALFAACDCFCLPSLERTEAFGLVLPEAMRYGRAIVASDIPGSGVGWVVRKGACGLLVPPGDPQALADALNRLTREPGLRHELGRRGKEAFERLFRIEAVARRVRQIYQEVVPARL